MEVFVVGATTMACWTAMLFFLRFWKDTGDRLFAMFSGAFFLLGVTRVGRIMFHESTEGDTYWYLARLAAYVLILIAIVDKNRQKSG
jgi:hypothetical protein